MKTLIVMGHPNVQESIINLAWLKELKQFSEEFVVHHLSEELINGEFDVLKEQQLLEKFDKIVLQFPIYWFNCPPLMKKWLDDVFIDGWAYGETNQMKNRNVALLVTAGIRARDYEVDGKCHHTLKEVLVPFELTFNYMEVNYRGVHAFYGAEHEGTGERIKESTFKMLEFIRAL